MAIQEKTLRFGMAGLGVASTQVLPGVERFPHVQIVAAADLRRSALEAFEKRYEGSRSYGNVDELFSDPDVDIVWIATPNHLHCQHVVSAADHGKQIICTKPMALSVAECEKMCDAADRNGVKLLCGQTFSMSPDAQAMVKVARSGELGRLIAVNNWLYTDWLIKPRVAEEVDESLGGGVIYRHAPHLIDTVRLLGGGMVRSVRAQAGRWMPERPCPGNFSAFLEFEDGTPATIVYNGYGYFDTSELTWGIGNRMYSDEERVKVRRMLKSGAIDNEVAKEGMRFGASTSDETSRGSGHPARETPVGTRADQHWFGVTVASFEHGDCRMSPNGVYVYGDDGRREIEVFGGRGVGTLEIQELYECLVHDQPIVHDGRWGMATMEVGEAIMKSAAERREIMLTHQVPAPD